jgi:RNA recognition motif-containing protein
MSDSGELTNQGQQQERDRGRDPDNDPPYSRLFVVCGKGAVEEDMEAQFQSFGTVQYCRIIRDKSTMESKGYAYVKYDKASSAAFAIEALNGKKLAEDQPPLKVMVADAKGTRSSRVQSREPEDTPPRSRLFVICAKEFSEDDLVERFRQFGDFEYCKVIKDKHTSESKGYAYVKYNKSSTAAVAMEEINKKAVQEGGLKLKVLIADPKTKSKQDVPPMAVAYPPIPMPLAFPYAPEMAAIPAYTIPPYAIPRQRLFVVCHKSVTQDQLARLFSRFPGMEYCDLKKNKQTGESKGFAYINYSTPQAALMAKEQMDGFEFPPGCILKVMFAEPLGLKNNSASEPPSISQIRDSFAQMMSYPGSIAYSSHASTAAPASPSDNNTNKTNDRYYPEGSRLFIVVTKPVPDYALQEVFSRYGALEYVRLQKDKNYGYAKYTTAAAAQYALQYLNNTEIHGQKVKIQIAHPPNNDSRKRQRV